MTDKRLPLYCYRKSKHGETAVDEKTLENIIANLPPEVFKPSWNGAAVHFITATALTVSSICVFSLLSWHFVPLGWILAAFALVNLFNIGHDCTHNAWTPSSFLNDIMGEIAFLPLLHPYQPFRHKHNNNEKLLQRTSLTASAMDLAFHPDSLLSTLGLRGFFREHYSISGFDKSLHPKVIPSILFSVVFMILFFGGLIYFGGIQAPIIYWLVPLLLYKDFFYVRWLDFSRHYLAVHFPPQIATRIPSYNLFYASKIIRKIFYHKFQAEELLRLQDDALKQKVGAPLQGYDHQYGKEMPPLKSGLKARAKYWISNISWVNTIIILGTPIVSVYGFFTTPLVTKTVLFSIAYYFYTGLGITAGYHRLWAHRSYEASFLVKVLLMLGGTGALEGSIKWWAGGHRVHHRYTDTPKDPYNAKFGFWWAHVGWMLAKPNKAYQVKADIRDLQADPMINFQHAHYAWLGPLMAFVVPSLIAGLGWGDWRGGYFFAGAARLLFVHHSTFCVNSLAHFFGSHTYDDDRSPRDNLITAFVTLGEGYHNFHHEFPNDYRNGIRFYDYDPTKWLIVGLSMFGLTFGLKEFPANEVSIGKLAMKQKKLDQEKGKLTYAAPITSLPGMTWEEYKLNVKRGHQYIAVEGVVHDVSRFIKVHPGGTTVLQLALGTDGTENFNGLRPDSYRHSNAARNLLTTFRIARIVDESQTKKDA